MKQQPAVRWLESVPGLIKRQGYFLGLGGAVLALLLGWRFELATGQAGSFDAFALPITAVLMLVLLFAFTRRRLATRPLELLAFSVLASFFLVQLVVALYYPSLDQQRINDQLAEFGFWFPTLYASILFILGVDKGLRVAIGHFALSVAVGLPFLLTSVVGGSAFDAVYSLTQLYLSSAVLISTLVVFVRYSESLVRAKAEMEHLANTDHVTELGNRRQMERLLLQEVTRSERYGDQVSVLLLDLDHFKLVNDLHGHAVGDEVLREVGALLLAESRTSDYVGRWGGEEFILILPKTSRDAALVLAERIVERINSHDFAQVGGITLSAGAASREVGEGADLLLRRADEALYHAKQTGRNRFVVSEGSS